MNAAFVLAFALSATAVAPQLGPSAVLTKYGAALSSVAEPKAVIFNYTIAQVGQPPLYQTHRIYRSGDLTRDETLEVDGHPLSSPGVRIQSGRSSRYRISETAPKPSDYTFTFVKAVQTGHHWSYVFKTVPNEARAFSVTGVTIDGASFLPSRIDFTTAAGTVEAKGMLVYAPFDRYWMIAEADVAAPVAGEASAERILWSNYAFPVSLPKETFKG